jgi:DNA polymerase-3 subunit delta'
MSNLVGQQRIKEQLWRLIDGNRLPHALLFYGSDGVGKEVAGLELARYLLCRNDQPPCGKCPACHKFSNFQHPDFYFLFPLKKPDKEIEGGEWEKAMSEKQLEEYRTELIAKSQNIYHRIILKQAQDILIAQVRQLIQKSSLTSFQGGNRFALISPAERMNKEAQNSLLKLLEEPPQGFYLCLVTSRPEALLPTVVSRCQGFYFPPLSREEIIKGLNLNYGTDTKDAEIIADRAEGSFVKAVEFLQQGDPYREIALDKFLTPAIMKKDIELFEFIQKYKRMEQKVEVRRILLNLDFWFRDIMRLDCGLEAQYNKDVKERLEKFRNNIEYRNLEEIRALILQAVDLLEKNVYIDNIFLNLALNIGRNMYLRKSKLKSIRA